MWYAIEAVLAILLIAVAFYFGIQYRKKVAEAQIGQAETKAREIVDDALKTADAKKREALIEAKEESMKLRNDVDKEIKERRSEVQKQEKRLVQKEEALDRKNEQLERKDNQMNRKLEEIERKNQEISQIHEKKIIELEKISGLTTEQAKEVLIRSIEDDVKHDVAVMIKENEARAKEESAKKAREILTGAIQRCAADHVAETTVSVVPLPNDEMKGRIIGREGRNIRALETMTGIDLIIDDTPEAVILSGFDGVRREIARIALEKLIVDGRIHPARIEEMVGKATKEVETKIREEGEAATFDTNVHGLHPELVRLLGGHTVIPVCPEVLGGLPTPRIPAEIVNGKVLNRNGDSVDEAFRKGAEKALETAKREKPDLIILQSRSPSCGVKEIYDGTFSGRKIPGQGIFAGLLTEAGFTVVDVEDLPEELK